MIRVVQGSYTTHNLPKGSQNVRIVCGDHVLRFPECEPPDKLIGCFCFCCNSGPTCYVEVDYACGEKFAGKTGKLLYNLDGKELEEDVVFVPDPRRG